MFTLSHPIVQHKQNPQLTQESGVGWQWLPPGGDAGQGQEHFRLSGLVVGVGGAGEGEDSWHAEGRGQGHPRELTSPESQHC